VTPAETRRGARDGQTRVDVVPTTQPKANAFVAKLHRHHAPIPGGFAWWCVAAIVDGTVRGVAIAGRPTNRNNDDGQTVEVLRVATDGTPNACSALLGACARAAKAIGARRVITYTLASESGASLRGAGWTCECEDTGKSWWTHAGTRTPAKEREHMGQSKARWGLVFRDAVSIAAPTPEPDAEPAQFALRGAL
jgi:hypothetical protein